jgi:transposase
VRVKRAQRGQITWGRVDLDAEVPADHEVRAIAAVVDQLDLRGLYADVRARGEIAGAPATQSPKILLGLWVYATRDGVGSGREIARLVEIHAAYRWLCGGVAAPGRKRPARHHHGRRSRDRRRQRQRHQRGSDQGQATPCSNRSRPAPASGPPSYSSMVATPVTTPSIRSPPRA